MNYTERYHLPQWEETDRIMRTDFNQMCADMEAGLEKTARDAAEDTAAVQSAALAAASAAQATADTAVSKADAARSVADNAYCPSNKPFTVGSYIGSGGTVDRTISLGFRPRFVILMGEQSGDSRFFAFGAEGVTRCPINLVSNGFTLLSLYNNFSLVNSSGKKYTYIAFP